jgi:oxygen-independent coproporphyrinogen-3 oxidase
MRMMQEKQTVIAMGAGAVSRLYFPDEDRIERIFNIADTTLYIERIDEMLERKKRIFKEK